MFKNLRTSTKLVALCGMFIVSLAVATYSLVIEKQIAIEFARKELVGTKYLAAVREIYAALLTAGPFGASAELPRTLAEGIVKVLTTAQHNSSDRLQTREPSQALAAALHHWSSNAGSPDAQPRVLHVLARARDLAARIADDSNLALDPDLDSYHVQDLVARKLPAFLRQVAEAQLLSREATEARIVSHERKARFQSLQGLLRSVTAEVQDNLAAAHRGNSDGSLKAIDGVFADMVSTTNAYLDGLNATFADGSAAAHNGLYRSVVERTIRAWSAAQSELDRLLQQRIDGLMAKMGFSLGLIGALLALTIVVAVMTHRHIVPPLERLEHVASTVRDTKDYTLRADYLSKNEIGQLTAAFNDMLSELGAAHERERSDHAALERAARLTTMGAMTASIAHELNQPLGAILSNAEAAELLLAANPPDVGQLKEIVADIRQDDLRAAEIIRHLRNLLKRRSEIELQVFDLNDVVAATLHIVSPEARKRSITLVADGIPGPVQVRANQVHLQQVMLNLATNGMDAIADAAAIERKLTIETALTEGSEVEVSVGDSGTGIPKEKLKDVFDTFYTTKQQGTGLGLSIARTIVETYGGKIWAENRPRGGAVFRFTLPLVEAQVS